MTKKQYEENYGFKPLPLKSFRRRKNEGLHMAGGKIFTSRSNDGAFVYTCPFCGKEGKKRGSAAGFVKATYMRHSYECELKALADFYGEAI